MPPIDLTLIDLDERGVGIVTLNGVRVDCKQLAIVAGADQPTEVTLVLTNVRVNYSQPPGAPRIARPFEEEAALSGCLVALGLCGRGPERRGARGLRTENQLPRASVVQPRVGSHG